MTSSPLRIGAIASGGDILDALMVERRCRNLSLPKLAARMYVTTPTLHNVVARRRRGASPQIRLLLAIADALDLEIHVTLRRKASS